MTECGMLSFIIAFYVRAFKVWSSYWYSIKTKSILCLHLHTFLPYKRSFYLSYFVTAHSSSPVSWIHYFLGFALSNHRLLFCRYVFSDIILKIDMYICNCILRDWVCQDDFCNFSKLNDLSIKKPPKTSCLHISWNTVFKGFLALSDCFTFTINVVW